MQDDSELWLGNILSILMKDSYYGNVKVNTTYAQRVNWI